MQQLTGLQFDICYVIKTREGLKIAEGSRKKSPPSLNLTLSLTYPWPLTWGFFPRGIFSWHHCRNDKIFKLYLQINLLFKLVHLKILENSQEYVYNEVIFFNKAFKCKVINVEFFSRDFYFKFFFSIGLVLFPVKAL